MKTLKNTADTIYSVASFQGGASGVKTGGRPEIIRPDKAEDDMRLLIDQGTSDYSCFPVILREDATEESRNILIL